MTRFCINPIYGQIRKAILLSSILCVAIGAASALKAVKDIPQPKNKIKKISHFRTGDFSQFRYTPDGKIWQTYNSNGNRVNYEYIGKMILKRTTDSISKRVITDTMKLNSKGLIYETHSYWGDSVSIYWLFSYDTSGFMTEFRTMDHGHAAVTRLSTYARGNEIAVKATLNKEKTSVMSYYTYYDDHLNTIGNDNLGMAFMGRSPKNLMKEEIYVPEKGDTTRRFYSYQFDDQGRARAKSVYIKSKMVDSIAFDYY